jgi:hypothetical protein
MSVQHPSLRYFLVRLSAVRRQHWYGTINFADVIFLFLRPHFTRRTPARLSLTCSSFPCNCNTEQHCPLSKTGFSACDTRLYRVFGAASKYQPLTHFVLHTWRLHLRRHLFLHPPPLDVGQQMKIHLGLRTENGSAAQPRKPPHWVSSALGKKSVLAPIARLRGFRLSHQREMILTV